MTDRLGNVLLIANPAAQNGRGAAAVLRAESCLRPRLGERLQVALTESARHAVDMAASAQRFQTVLALGGDGVIHEVANGLMRIPVDERPVLGVIPVGSGNDYARAIGMTRDVDRDCAALLEAVPQCVDVGCVNGRWFVETLSFGLDAAIALDTVERRVRTGRTGTLLYLASGFDQLFHHLEARPYRAGFDGMPPVAGDEITFAVQIGPYYGGGFKVCPDALLGDGAFDVCIAHPPIGVAKAAFIFLCAKGGHHTRFACMDLFRAHRIHVEFPEAPPAQIDGERIEGTVFDVSIDHAALQVLTPGA